MTRTPRGRPVPAPAKSSPPAGAGKRIAVLFSDDSTLIFARRIYDVLKAARPTVQIDMVLFAPENALSYRQLEQHLPSGPDKMVNRRQLDGMLKDPAYSAVITSRVYRPITLMSQKKEYRWAGARPCIIAFLGGLDFFPTNGFARRRNCDGVFVFPKSRIDSYQALFGEHQGGWQQVGFGHPTVVRPTSVEDQDLSDRTDIYFFTQAISPLTRRARVHILKVMAAIARANPTRNVYIKLRHLPTENTEHLHTEIHDYPSLLRRLKSPPPNLIVTDVSMDTALETAAVGITCTSTAALDLVRAGVPSLVYLDYVDTYRDPLVPPMRELFEHSGLISSLDDVLNLRHNDPDPHWLADMFCPDDLGDRIFEMIRDFRARTVQSEMYRPT